MSRRDDSFSTIPSGGVVRPNDLAKCKVWLRADLGVGTPVDGDAIGTWVNQADAAALASVGQAVGAQKPLWKELGPHRLPGLRFDGVDDSLDGTYAAALTSPYEVWAVLSAQQSGVRQAIIASVGNVNVYIASLHNINVFNLAWYAGVHLAGSANSWVEDETWIFRVEENGVASVLKKNDGVRASGASGGGQMSDMRIGLGYAATGNPFKGDISEVCVFNALLTAAERLNMLRYLEARYGL